MCYHINTYNANVLLFLVYNSSYLQYSIDITIEQTFWYMEFTDAKNMDFKNMSLCRILQIGSQISIKNCLFGTCNYKHHSIVLGYVTIKLFFFETFHIYNIRI